MREAGSLEEGQNRSTIGRRRVFTDRLATLKRRSPHSYKQLARLLDRPSSTIHGWCTGKHLPYARDNDAFLQMLELLSVSPDEQERMLHEAAELRSLGAIEGADDESDNESGRDSDRGNRADDPMDGSIEASDLARRRAARADAVRLARQIALHADVVGRHDPILGAHVAVAAWDVAATTESRSALLSSFALRGTRRFVDHHDIDRADTRTAFDAAPSVDDLRLLGCSEATIEAITADERSDSGRWGRPPTIRAVDLESSGDRIVVGFDDGAVQMWSTDGSTTRQDLVLGSDRLGVQITSVAFDSTGRIIAAGDTSGTVRMWSSSSLQQLPHVVPHPAAVTSVSFSGDGELVTTCRDAVVRTWHVDPWIRSADEIAPSVSLVDSADIDRTGAVLLRGTRARKLLDRHNPESRSAPAPGDVSLDDVSLGDVSLGDGRLVASGAAALSPDGAHMVIGTDSGDIVLAASDGSASSLVDSVASTSIRACHWSPDGRFVAASCDDGIVQIWQVVDRTAAGSLGCSLEHQDKASVATPGVAITISHDSRLLALVGSDGTTTIFRVGASGKLEKADAIRSTRHHTLGAAFHPSRNLLALGTLECTVSLWHCFVDEEPVHAATLHTPSSPVDAVAFHPDGSRLGGGSADGRIWIWETDVLRTPRFWASIDTDGLAVSSLAFDEATNTLLAAGRHGRLGSWCLDEASVRSDIIATGGDPLTEEEWVSLIPPESPHRPTPVDPTAWS